MTDLGSRLSGAIRPATVDDLPAMARIHAGSGTPGLLSDLGERFLRDVYYRNLLASPAGRAEVLALGSGVIGLVTWSPDSDRLFGQIFATGRRRTIRAILQASRRKPRVLLDFLQSVLSVKGIGAGAAIPAEIVSLEIAPAQQGLGLGYVLLERSVRALQAEGHRAIKARILADHAAVERLYLRLGFRRTTPFRLHGRDWVLMVLGDGDAGG
jgi:GNAT superfamily N-acetyltransferase